MMSRALLLVLSLLVASAAAATSIEPPTLLAEPDVVYPRDAFLEGVAGLVTMSIELDEEGRVQYVAIDSSPDARLGWAALGAVANLPFTPAYHVDPGDKHPIAVRFQYTLTFAIDEAERQHLLAHEAHDETFGHAHTQHGDDDHHQHDDADPIAGAHTPAPATLTGQVRSADDAHIPIVDAVVFVDGQDLQTTTDDQGRFVLRDLPDGPLLLLVDAVGYAPGHVEFYDREIGDLLDVVIYVESSGGRDDETVVGGRHLRREVVKRQLTQSVAVLDEEALARIHGRSLADTVREVPGVTMVQAGPVSAKPVVRGQFGRRLLVLTDGVRLESQDWGVDHAPEVDVSGAGEISVVKGAAGVRYGADAIGGVIIVTPKPLRLQPGLDGELRLMGIDNGLVGMVGGRVDVVIPELPSWSFRAELNGTRGAARAAPDYILGNTASEIENAGVTAEWRARLLDQPLTLTFAARRHQENLGVCFCLQVNTPDDLAALAKASRPPGSDAWTMDDTIDRPRQAVVHDTFLTRARLDLGDGGDLTLSYALQHDVRQEFDQVRGNTSGAQFNFDLVTHAVDATWEHRHLQHGSLSLTGLYGTHVDFQQHRFDGLQLIPNYQRGTGGLYALETGRLNDVAGLFDVQLLLGARVDGLLQTTFLAERAYDSQVRRGRLNDGDCELTTSASGELVAHCDKNLPALSLTAGTRLTTDAFGAKDALAIQLDVSTATRFPDVDELYLGGRAPSFPVLGLGDGSLGPERTTQVSIGGSVATPALRFELGGYASHIDNYIAFGPELDDDGQPIVDVLISGTYPRFGYRAVEAMIGGIDGSAVFFADQPLSILAQGAIVRGLDLSDGGYLPFIPPNQARLELRVRPPLPDVGDVPALADFPLGLQGPELTTGVVMVARQDRFDGGTDFAPPADAYALWNASASAALSLWDWPVDVGVEVRNILNTAYRDQLSLLRYFADQPGREVWVRLGTTFDVPLARR